MTVIGETAGIVVGALVGVLVLGAIAQRAAERRDRQRHPAPGLLIDADGCRLHVVVSGTGPPVLIDSGLGGSCIEWGPIADELAQDFTVIRYDRPGFAWSPGGPCDRRPAAAAARMRAILRSLGIAGPSILVGHSLGGINVRMVALLYPELVAGLVLVDPSHEEQLEVAETAKALGLMKRVLTVLVIIAPFGIGRLVGRVFGRLGAAELRRPLGARERELAHVTELLTMRTVHGIRATAAETSALPQSLAQLREVARSAPAPQVPITVITAAAPSSHPKIAKARAQIDRLHADLVARSPRGTHVLAERSGHLVPLDQPEIIASCVRGTAAAPGVR